MYNGNLNKDLRLRLNEVDFDFLSDLAEKRDCSVSEVIRQIIGEYRRGLENLEILKKSLEVITKGDVQNGDTKTDQHGAMV